MTSPNGRLQPNELVQVNPVEYLSPPTANAYRNLAILAAQHGRPIALASPGAGYRDFQCQSEMRAGSTGNVALAKKWGLNPDSSVPLAAAGSSSHGFGTRVDLLFAGSDQPTDADLARAKQCGFTREFGTDDPNHFEHDGHTAISAPALGALDAAHVWHRPYNPPKPGPGASK